MRGTASVLVPDDLRAAIKALDAVKADVARRREAGEDWHLGEGLLHEQIAQRLALDFARAVLSAETPSPASSTSRVGEGE